MTTAATHDSFVIERTYKASPERVFAAWTDPAQKRAWFVEGEGWTILSYEADIRTGGVERSRFRFEDGPEMTNTTFHHVIEPNRRLVASYDMTLAGKPFSVSLSTLELIPDGDGTRLVLTEQAAFFEGADGVANRKRGCEELLGKLAEALGEPS